MQIAERQNEQVERQPAVPPEYDAICPPCEIGLSLGEWGVAAIIILAVLLLGGRAWRLVEKFEPSRDYRVPSDLSDDYWLFRRYSGLEGADVAVIGDSVIWGPYVAQADTLTGRLNALSPRVRFRNLGVDGLHPTAMAGLLDCYGGGLSGKDVVLHCNLLWMSDKRSDLGEGKEYAFNHPRLLPQLRLRPDCLAEVRSGAPGILMQPQSWFEPRCYNEPISGRLAIDINRRLPFAAWSSHLRLAYFGRSDIPNWTLEHPYDNPLAVSRTLVGRGEDAPTEMLKNFEQRREPGSFPAQWVELDASLQWRSIQRAVSILRGRECRVFVVVGPFNEYMLKDEARSAYRQRLTGVENWLKANQVAYFIPPVLPAGDYADASHPVREGYETLAEELLADPQFAAFLAGRRSP